MKKKAILSAALVAIPCLFIGPAWSQETETGDKPAAEEKKKNQEEAETEEDAAKTEDAEPNKPGSVVIIGRGGEASASVRALEKKQGNSRRIPLGNVSLADVVKATEKAKQERESRTELATITNESLGIPEDGNATSRPPEVTIRGEDGSYDSIRDSKGRGEEYWRNMLDATKADISRLEVRIADLESEVNGLRNAFYSQDDPAYRDGVIKPKWDRAIAALDQAKSNLVSRRQALTDLKEDARRSGALPGWLR